MAPVSETDNEEDGIVFQAEHGKDNKELTAVETILPWRRRSSFAPDDQNNAAQADDTVSLVLKQEEFPVWISNKQHLPQGYASPSTTLIQSLDKERNNTTSIFSIFGGETRVSQAAAAAGARHASTPSAATGANSESTRHQRPAGKTDQQKSANTDTKTKADQSAENAAFVHDMDDDPVTKL